MTRLAPLALAMAALLTSVACSQPEPSAARATPTPAPTPAEPPIAVHVQSSEDADAAAWAETLRMAVIEGSGNLSLAETPAGAALTVRIDSVKTGVKFEPEPAGEGEISVMRGALVTGKTAQPFQLAYKGEARPQAEALARNLRRFAMGTGAAGSKPAEPGDETKKPEAPKSEVDE